MAPVPCCSCVPPGRSAVAPHDERAKPLRAIGRTRLILSPVQDSHTNTRQCRQAPAMEEIFQHEAPLSSTRERAKQRLLLSSAMDVMSLNAVCEYKERKVCVRKSTTTLSYRYHV